VLLIFNSYIQGFRIVKRIKKGDYPNTNYSVKRFFSIRHNGLAPGAMVDFGAQNYPYSTKVDTR